MRRRGIGAVAGARWWPGVASVVLTGALAGCAAVPTPPPPLPSDFYPDASHGAVAPPSTDALIEGFTRAQRLAVRIRVETCTGWSTGSGWILSGTEVVTNRHVIDGATRIEVTTYDGRDYVALSSRVADVPDLGVVTLDDVFSESVTTSEVALKTDDAVVIAGYPSGDQLMVQDGEFWGEQADTVGATGELVWLISAEAKPGSSGSPVYDEHGDVVAIIYAGDDAGAALAWPVSWLNDLIEDPAGWSDNSTVCPG